MYQDGCGVSKDNAQAHMWFSLAAAQGDDESAEIRDKIASGMTPDQIAEAQSLARDWQEKHGKAV